MKTIVMSIFLLLMNSCHDSDSELIDKYNSDELEIFKHLSLRVRGVNEAGEKIISKIQFNVNLDKRLSIPTSQIDTTNADFKEFMKIKGYPLDSVILLKEFINSVLEKTNELGFNSLDSYPWLGEFEVFQIDEDTRLVHLRDSNKVLHTYWKDFFTKNKPVKPNLYLMYDEQ